MEVSNISAAPSSISASLLNKFQLGERLLVEVVQKLNDGEGTVRVKGQNMHALLETSTQAGEKFWVKVGSLNEGGLLLIREPILGKLKDFSSAPQQLQQIIERGLPNNQEIIALIKSFQTSNIGLFRSLFGCMQGTSITDELLTNLKKAIPQWNSFSEDNGMEELLSSLKKLGLNYEQRIQQMMKLDYPARGIEKQMLQETFKGMLLKIIRGQTSEDMSDSDGPLLQLLQKITGQQLWFKTGTMDSAYMMLHIPLLNKEQFVPVQIAIESARKGLKMDEQHCRIAILVETQELGEIGIDAFFNENSFTCRVLSNDLQFLPALLEAVVPETRERFAKLGFHIERVEMGELDQNLEFKHFLQGSRRTGVDISR
ncbi:hypothetical protein [Desulfosporosinus nitroreducens]|uniref:Flagellar hook-length control protein-like C-terminal domain-containing protein n=1 Tax=Desulfosporosinus nitroreducens TaxID=2018668 RepID=A0ABT8QKT8_9FIRM|nr:hypothetical protein [Desulfosporosinus nitroreducens]MCO1600419.1 hypothetical protein [Desulfosporosinus nitroreducens]MDO0821507.1 hypothetical protein [Desulfosporosinus nitroreducens]